MAKAAKKTFDLTNRSLREVWSQVNASEENFEKILSYFKDLRNSPFKVNADEFSSSLALVVATNLISSGGKDGDEQAAELAGNDDVEPEMDGSDDTVPSKKKPYEIVWAKLRKQDAVVSALYAQVKNFAASAAQIGSHSAKIPNTAASGKTVFMMDDTIYQAAKTSPFLSSATFETPQRMGGGTNAAQNATNRFLLISFDIDGEIVNVGDSIAALGIVYNGLIELGMDKKALDHLAAELVSQRRMDASFPLGDNQRCLIWPTADGDVQITPVHPFAMQFELNSRIRRRKETPNWLMTERVKVGGAQPQNAGVINNMFSGQHYLLSSLPPVPLSPAERRYYQQVTLGTLDLAPLRTSDPNAKALAVAITKEGGMNKENRDVIEQLIDRVIYTVLVPFFSVAKLLRNHPDDAETVLGNIKGSARSLLESGFEHLAEKDEFCKTAARKALVGLKGVPASDELDVIFRKAVENILRKSFKGI
jgi:hypothetical protein